MDAYEGKAMGMNAIFNRLSVRQFQEIPVEEDKVTMLLKAAMAAPSAANQQPWEFYVVHDIGILTELAKCSPYSKSVKGAPMAIVCCYRSQGLWQPECALLDLSAATQNILLEAVDLGLGAVWLCIAPFADRMAAVREVLPLPEGIEAFSVIPVGYALKDRPATDRYDETRIHRL